MLNILNTIPDGLLQASHQQLFALLGGPTLIHLEGRRSEPLFVSVLLHGNEDTSFHAIQALLTKYQDQPLPRSLSIFFGNLEAAQYDQRRLGHQPDYNRIWPGANGDDFPEQAIMQTVFNEMRQRKVFASIDIHNNTGLNPHYGCINSLDPRFLHLAAMFSRTVVYFIRPKGVQSMAFARLCPSITIECGKVGERSSIGHALEFVEGCLHLSEHPDHPIAKHDIDLFHTVATVKINPACSFDFEQRTSDISFNNDLEYFNFRELPVGTRLGLAQSLTPLEVIDEQGQPATEQFFHTEGGELYTARPVMPSMLTLDQQVIRQDCLCYLMERVPLAMLADPVLHKQLSASRVTD